MSTSQPALRVVIGSIDSLHRFDPSRKRHSLRVASYGKFDQNQNSNEMTVANVESDGPGLILQRKDIFYSGSLVKLPNLVIDGHKGTELAQSESRNTLDHINMKPLGGDEDQRKRRCCGFLPCPAEIIQAFKSMTDFSILKDPIFLFFAFSNFFTSVGYNIPYIYLVVREALLRKKCRTNKNHKNGGI